MIIRSPVVPLSKSRGFVFYGLILFSLISFVASFFCGINPLVILRSSLSYFLAALVFIKAASLEFKQKFAIQVLRFVLLFVSFSFLLQLFPPILALFVNRAMFFAGSSRGLTGFYSEGGYVVEAMIIFSFLHILLRERNYIYLSLPFIFSLLTLAGQNLKTYGLVAILFAIFGLLRLLFVFLSSYSIKFSILFKFTWIKLCALVITPIVLWFIFISYDFSNLRVYILAQTLWSYKTEVFSFLNSTGDVSFVYKFSAWFQAPLALLYEPLTSALLSFML